MKIIKYITIGLLTLVIIGFVVAFNTYGLDRYKEMSSPYDLNEEYNTVLISRLIRTYAGKIGIGDDSWILSPVLSWHKKAYKRAMKVIPEDDGERLIWEIDYYIEGFEKLDSNHIFRLHDSIEHLRTQKIRNKYFNEFEKYSLVNGILKESVNFYKELNSYQKKYLIDISFELSKEIEFEKFISKRSQRMKLIPLRLPLNGFVLFLIDSNYKYLYDCPEKAEILKYFNNRLLDLFQKYESIDKDKVQESLAFSKSQYEIVKNKIPEIINSCNN